MLRHTTLDQLRELRLHGMAQAFEEQLSLPDRSELSFKERLGLLVEREVAERSSRRLTARLRKARLREPAALEDTDWRVSRGLDKGQILRLGSCQWIADHLNVLITGKAGVGKTFLACALAHKACRAGYTALYLRMPRLFRDLAIARGDGSYEKLLKSYARTDLLVLDDWGLAPLGGPERRDLLEILEDRYGLRSTLVASQFPVKSWYELIGDPTLADSILDRLLHGAYTITGAGIQNQKGRLGRYAAYLPGGLSVHIPSQPQEAASLLTHVRRRHHGGGLRLAAPRFPEQLHLEYRSSLGILG